MVCAMEFRVEGLGLGLMQNWPLCSEKHRAAKPRGGTIASNYSCEMRDSRLLDIALVISSATLVSALFRLKLVLSESQGLKLAP